MVTLRRVIYLFFFFFWLIRSYRKSLWLHSNILPQDKEPCLKESLLICSPRTHNSLRMLLHLTVPHVNVRQICEVVYPWTPRPARHTPSTNRHQAGDAIWPNTVKTFLRVSNLLFHSITELFVNTFIQILSKIYYYKINLKIRVYIFSHNSWFEIRSVKCMAGIQANLHLE